VTLAYTLLFLWSCVGTVAADLPPSEAETPEPATEVAVESEEEAAMASVPTGAELLQASSLFDPTPVVSSHWDVVHFLGWSSDDARYAFAVQVPGQGGAECEGHTALYVVDAAKDAYVPGSRLEFAYERADVAECSSPDPRTALEAALPGALEEHGIDPGRQGRIVAVTGDEEGAALTVGLGLPLRLEVSPTQPDPPDVSVGTGFRAVLTDGDTELLLEAGTRYRPFIEAYHPRLVVVAPGGGHAALFTERIGWGFEGKAHSYMSNGFVLPEAWRLE